MLGKVGKGGAVRKMPCSGLRLSLIPLLFALVLLPASSATATPILWTLMDVTFDDGATASGTFSTDSVTGNLLSYDISTTAGLLPAEHYDGIGDHKFADNFFTPNSFLIILDASVHYIKLHFENPLNGSGVNPLVTGGGSFEVCDACNVLRAVTDGYATTDVGKAVPEPGTLFLLGSGLGGLALRRVALPSRPKKFAGPALVQAGHSCVYFRLRSRSIDSRPRSMTSRTTCVAGKTWSRRSGLNRGPADYELASG